MRMADEVRNDEREEGATQARVEAEWPRTMAEAMEILMVDRFIYDCQ